MRLLRLTIIACMAASPALAFEAQNVGSVGAPYTAPTDNGQTTNTAAGNGAQATGLASTAYGNQSEASGNSSTAVGSGSIADALSSTALGALSQAAAPDTTAVGYGAVASGANSVAVGDRSYAPVANTFSVGDVGFERKIVNVAPGTISSTSTDAVNGSQLNATNTQVSNLNTTVTNQGTQINQNTADIASLNSSMGGINSSLNNLNNSVATLAQNSAMNFSTIYGRLNSIQSESRQGIAMAAAMAQAPMPSAPGKTTWKINNAAYKNYGASSFSVAHRLPTAAPIAVTAGVAVGYRNAAIVTGGLQGEF